MTPVSKLSSVFTEHSTICLYLCKIVKKIFVKDFFHELYHQCNIKRNTTNRVILLKTYMYQKKKKKRNTLMYKCNSTNTDMCLHSHVYMHTHTCIHTLMIGFSNSILKVRRVPSSAPWCTQSKSVHSSCSTNPNSVCVLINKLFFPPPF